MKDEKDITPTVFGFMVAYLLPGLVALVTLALFLKPVEALLTSFSSAQSTVGLFLFVVLLALALGMQLTACRWFVFEKLIFQNLKFEPEDFVALRSPELASSFRILIDEAYRYHQFFGALVFVIPPLFVGTLVRSGLSLGTWSGAAVAVFATALEVITFATAAEGWRRYVLRGKAVLKGDTHGNGVQESSQEGSKEDSEKDKEDSQEGG